MEKLKYPPHWYLWSELLFCFLNLIPAIILGALFGLFSVQVQQYANHVLPEGVTGFAFPLIYFPVSFLFLAPLIPIEIFLFQKFRKEKASTTLTSYRLSGLSVGMGGLLVLPPVHGLALAWIAGLLSTIVAILSIAFVVRAFVRLR